MKPENSKSIKIIDSQYESKEDHSYCPIEIVNNKVTPGIPLIYGDGYSKTYSNKTHIEAMLQFITKK